MKKYVLILAGIPASGKTAYAKHIANKLGIPQICKDDIKIELYNILRYDPTSREDSKTYGAASYAAFYYFAECLMKTGQPFIMESNFTPASKNTLEPLMEKYGYTPLTIMFDAESKVLHDRFVKRDRSPLRHAGLKSQAHYDFGYFDTTTAPLRDFKVGEKIVIDTTELEKVDYAQIDSMVYSFIEKEEYRG